jgi:uridine kinase
MIRLKLEGRHSRTMPAGITVGEAAQLVGKPTCREACAALLNNEFVDLQTPIHRSGRLSFVGLATRDGNRMYQRSLTFLLVAAVRDVYPDLKVIIHHSLCKGLYCELATNHSRGIKRIVLTEADLEKIKQRMIKWVQADVPFVREEMGLEEARRLFQRQGHTEKADLLRYRTDAVINLYRLGAHREHFCGYLLARTGCVRHFDLKLCPPGFILRHPEDRDPDRLPEFVDNPKLFRVFLEYGQWCKILGLNTVAALDEAVASGGIAEFIKIAEALHEKRIAQIADLITQSPTCAQIVLVAGPSASGKTTSAKRLAVQLRVNGYRPLIISLDDYFFERSKTPRDESGKVDFEAIEAIDAELFNRQLRQLLDGRIVTLPLYDFQSGKRTKGRAVSIKRGDIVIAEGIHAFNRQLTDAIPEGLKFKLYISALTQLNLDNLNRLSTSDTRLIRRIVRDSRDRDYSAAETLGRWPSVRRGEEKNIFPYQEDADAIFNSALIYEYSALKPYAEAALRRIGPRDETYAEARRILYLLSYFLPIESSDIPSSSILREFIGRSSFAS